MSIPFKKCPFCGAHPHHGLTKVEFDQLHGDPFQRYRIWCPKGHADVRSVNRELATFEWNHRPGEQGWAEAVLAAAEIAAGMAPYTEETIAAAPSHAILSNVVEVSKSRFARRISHAIIKQLKLAPPPAPPHAEEPST